MAALNVVLNGTFTVNDTTAPGTFQGTMAYSDRGVGGGPVFPPSGGGEHPEHPIYYPPHPAHPIELPDPPGGGQPPPDVSPGADKKPPPTGGWGYVATWDDGSPGGWGYFAAQSDKPQPPGPGVPPLDPNRPQVNPLPAGAPPRR